MSLYLASLLLCNALLAFHIVYSSGSQPGVLEKVTGGTRNIKKCSKEAFMGRIFYLGVREGHIILIWGYTEGYNFDLGVRGYQKDENPWYTVF